VYDYTAVASEYFDVSLVQGPAVFHLHGQHSGIIQINTPEEFEKHGPALDKLFPIINGQCFWIVVGHSGKNNPTIEKLVQLARFWHRLYWVPFTDPPDESVLRELRKPTKEGYLVRNYDADEFFVALAREAGFDPSEFLGGGAVLGGPRGPLEEPAPVIAGWREEETLVVPESHRGLVVNLARFNRKGYESPEQLLAGWGQLDFRPRALESNWGPLIVAVEHHVDTLRHCWVVCSPQVREDFQLVERLIKLMSHAECHAVNLQNHNSILDVQQSVKAIYDNLGRECGLRPDELIADITGGNSAMTAGVVLATLEDDRGIEYLRQDVRLVQASPDGTAAALTRKQIREQQILIGIRTSGAMVREAALREAAQEAG
jgi:hypothetical protein